MKQKLFLVFLILFFNNDAGRTNPNIDVKNTSDDRRISGAFVPDENCNLQGQVVHVESNMGGQKNKWGLTIKLPSGKIIVVWLTSDNRPAVQKCDWIKITACHVEVRNPNASDHDTDIIIIDGFEIVPEPKPVPKPKSSSKIAPSKPVGETIKPKDPETKTGDPSITGIPDCKEGDTRDASTEKKEFTLLDETGDIGISVFTSLDHTKALNLEFADYMEKISELLKIAGKALPGPAKFVVRVSREYFSGTATIVKKINGSTEGVKSISAQITFQEQKVTVTKTIAEICKKGKWVTETRCEISKSKSSPVIKYCSISKFETAWQDKIVSDSTPLTIDTAKLDKWVKDCVQQHLDTYTGSEDEYGKYVKDCK